jgi:hypothetical protein
LIHNIKQVKKSSLPSSLPEIGFLNDESRKSFFKKYTLEIDHSSTELLKELTRIDLSNFSQLDHGMTGLSLKNEKFIQQDLDVDTLFIRNYYPHLLAKIRSFKRVCLIGNPGTQKSMFQFYYMARLMNPKLLGNNIIILVISNNYNIINNNDNNNN